MPAMQGGIENFKRRIMEFTDQMNRAINLPNTPKRIVSIVPSQTELLHNLGLDMEVVGTTKFCVHPQSWFRNKTRIGGTKSLNVEKIASLNPDLIIANREENEQCQITALEKIAPVWISDVQNLDHALKMIESIGAMVNKKANALKLVNEIKAAFEKFKPRFTSEQTKNVLYLIWHNPYMTVGSDTFISHMLSRCGLNNCIMQTRYPNIDIDEIKALNPDFIFLSSEPFPFKQKHIEELQRELPETKIEMVDGEMFSWYGSRLKLAPAYFEALLQKL
jgi:ABC-type Fe3+-hydroxamate transport system substrate-binding protein